MEGELLVVLAVEEGLQEVLVEEEEGEGLPVVQVEEAELQVYLEGEEEHRAFREEGVSLQSSLVEV